MALWLLLALAASPFDKASEAYAKADADAVIALYRQSPPASARDHALLGKARFLNGDFKGAASELDAAVKAEPSSAEYALWLGRATGRQAQSASPLSAPGLAVQTRKLFEKAVELDPKSVDALTDLFLYYLNAPGFLGGGESKAAALIPKVRALAPSQAHHLDALLAESRKDWPAAETAFKKAAEAAPAEPGRQIELARFYAQQRRFDEADALFGKITRLTPDHPPLLFAQAETLIESKRDPAEARALLKRYLDLPLTPDYPTRRDAEKLLAKVR